MKIQLRKEIAWQKIANKIFIMNEENGLVMCLEDSGVDFWLLLLEEDSFEQILVELSKLYEINDTEIRADFLELINQLEQAGILELRCDNTKV